MKKALAIGIVFSVAWLATGFCPLIEVRKGANFVLGHWPLMAAYGTPIDAWQYISLHLVISALATALAFIAWRTGRSLMRHDLTRRCG